MAVVEERLTVLEVKMEEVGTTLVRIERMLDSLYEIAQGLDVKAATLDQKVTWPRRERSTGSIGGWYMQNVALTSCSSGSSAFR
jgi:hypothetical protein